MGGVWVPEEFVNQIRWRKVARKKFCSEELELHFSTWQEAHAWLMEDRRKKRDRAQKELDAANRSLAKALKMQAPKEDFQLKG